VEHFSKSFASLGLHRVEPRVALFGRNLLV
jgi:hypothetical protein